MEGENRAGENSCVRYIRQIGPNLYHIFGPSSWTLGPIPKQLEMDNLHTCGGNIFKFQPSRFKTVGRVHREMNKMACLL